MRILALGDVVGESSVAYLKQQLGAVCRRESIDFTVVNGENASEIRGLSACDAQALLDAGADLITLGNHAFGKQSLYPFLDDFPNRIIRPANYPATAPGCGYTVVPVNGWRLLCINVCGRVYLDPLADPFATVEQILARESGNYDLALMDIHAEATSEKLALGLYFDGKIQVLFGTHTHVATADERILPHGSGYITDLGMCAPQNGVLGTDADAVISRFRTMMPTKFPVASGAVCAEGAVFEVDERSARVRSVRRIRF